MKPQHAFDDLLKSYKLTPVPGGVEELPNLSVEVLEEDWDRGRDNAVGDESLVLQDFVMETRARTGGGKVAVGAFRVDDDGEFTVVLNAKDWLSMLAFCVQSAIREETLKAELKQALKEEIERKKINGSGPRGRGRRF